MAALAETVERLCELSARGSGAKRVPLAWPEAWPEDGWAMSPELTSLYGTPAWQALDEAGQRRLAFWEAVSFFSLNIHGERALMEGLARRLYARRTAAWTPYLHHFLAEENEHMQCFGGFCRRYAQKIYPERKLHGLCGEAAEGEEDLVFFARVLIFEEIVDAYNVALSRDERLVPVARDINLIHHLDETRHLAFGRLAVAELWQTLSPGWAPEVVARVRAHLAGFYDATLRDYYNPDVYRDAGLAEPYRLRNEAWLDPGQVEKRQRLAGRSRRYLAQLGLFTEEVNA
jgi:hypothetical protein